MRNLGYKIYAYYESKCAYSYPLLDFDLFTILDLAYSRQVYKQRISANSFFDSDDVKEKEVYTRIKELLEKYINNYEAKNANYKKNENFNSSEQDEGVLSKDVNWIISSKNPFEILRNRLVELNIEPDERFVYYFFKVIKQLFPKS